MKGLVTLAALAAVSFSALAAVPGAVPNTDVDALLRDIRSGKTAAAAPRTDRTPSVDISSYAAKVQAAINAELYNTSKLKGKTCALRLQLAPDGALLDATITQSAKNDPTLCQEAIQAVRNAQFPKPESDAVYQAFKSFPLDFRL